MQLIRKGGSTSSDREAIRLLRQHGILSMATWVAGFEDEGFRDLWRGFRQLIAYDPDQIQALYVTPHRWTPFFRIARDRKVIQTDARLWDYKHQVLQMTRLKPWMLFFSVKLIEVAVQSRPKALARILFHPDPEQRHSMRWYTQMGRRVWFREVWGFLVRDRPREGRPDACRILGRAAGRRGGIDDRSTPAAQAGRACRSRFRRAPEPALAVFQDHTWRMCIDIRGVCIHIRHTGRMSIAVPNWSAAIQNPEALRTALAFRRSHVAIVGRSGLPCLNGVKQ